jgi:glycosyltransferase 2 family protein
MNKRVSTIIQYFIFLTLGFLFVWLSLKNLNSENLRQIKNALKNAKYWLIIPVFGMLILSHFVRAMRWRLLIEPLGHSPARANAFFAVMIGYLVNQGVPRLGELVKCTMLSRYEKVPVEKLIGTIILERVVDALTFLTILGITLAIQPDIYSELVSSFFSRPGSPETKKIPGYLIMIGLLVLLMLIIGAWMLIRKKNMNDLKQLLKRIWQRIWEGISSVQHLKKRGLFILLTVILWSLYLFSGYIGFFAFRETTGYGIPEAFTVLSAGSIGMIASPGGIGAYAYLIQKTMPVYGLQEGVALAFGWILWLVTTAVIVTGGLISFVWMPYYNKRYKSEKT